MAFLNFQPNVQRIASQFRETMTDIYNQTMHMNANDWVITTQIAYIAYVHLIHSDNESSVFPHITATPSYTIYPQNITPRLSL